MGNTHWGNIPHQIGNLSNLKVLDLSSSYSQKLMTYDMAWVSRLSKLEHLDLSGMNLSRTQNLDTLLYMIPSLLKLRLSSCELSMGHLVSHHLNFSIELPGLKHLDLSGNVFKGQLPALFLNLTSLEFLDLSRSYSSVSNAWSFVNLLNMIPSVSELHLAGCNLQKIHFSSTNFSFGAHSNIQHLDLNRNEIRGGIPYLLTNMSSLLSLDLSYNGLNSSISLPTNLLKLDINTNRFRHIEDVGIWKQCHLKELVCSYNSLEGEITGSSTNVSKCNQNALEILYLNDNALNGSIPESLGRLTSLRHLDLSFNEPNKVWFYVDITSGFATGFWGIIAVLLFKKQWRRKFFMFSEEAIDMVYYTATDKL